MTDQHDPAAAPIFYACVIGDVLGTFQEWRQGRADESRVAVTSSSQFFDMCRALGRPGVAASVSGTPSVTKGDGFTIIMQPKVGFPKGIKFHLAMLRRSFALLREIRRSGATDVIAQDGAGYWFPLALLPRRVRLFVAVHTVLWHEGQRPGVLRRLVLALEGRFLRRRSAGALVVSDAIGRQIAQLAQGSDLPIRRFQPVYEARNFADVAPADPTRRPFRIMFAGNMESNKGIFDMVDLTKALLAEGRDVLVTMCGSGSQLEALRARVASEALEDRIALPGYQVREQMIAHLVAAHCVIVPTRSSFVEGFNKVVVEAVLAGRPVVTSRVCPALERVAAAAMEAQPDDVPSYVDAVRRLMDDPALYREKVAASRMLAASFTDREQGFGALAKTALLHPRLA
jgi:glycogen synthase